MTKVVDADGHILEPSDLWEKNLEPEYRDRAIRLRIDSDGWSTWSLRARSQSVSAVGASTASAAWMRT